MIVDSFDPKKYKRSTQEINPIKMQYGVRSYEELATLSEDTKILNNLAEKNWDNPSVCRKVAKNFNTSEEMLDKLSKHPADIVREGVAEQGNLNMKISMRLVFDKSKDVRATLARKTKHEAITKFLIQFYCNESKIMNNVLMRAENRKVILEFINSDFVKIVRALLSNKSLKPVYLKACLEAQLNNPSLHYVDLVLTHPNHTQGLEEFVIKNFSGVLLNEEEIAVLKKIVE